MAEFWETSFKEKQEMWGDTPADSAIRTSILFKEHNISKVLIPGFGYGRNAGVFIQNGCSVTGIEISETAIELAGKHFSDKVKIYNGSVTDMPFDDEKYEGIYCYALLHLLNAQDRLKLIKDCYEQLQPGGIMVFVTLSKKDFRFGEGPIIAPDTFLTKHGISLYFYDQDTVNADFGDWGLWTAKEINDPEVSDGNKPVQCFWQVTCKKN